jgi:glycosyltransferase involved in cell wall biosynthesis
MRILHLNELYPPKVLGGAERSVSMLAEAQVRAGHEVAVACTTDGSFISEERAGVTVFRMPHESLFWSEDWPNHSRLKRVWRKFAMPFNVGMRRHFEHVLQLTKPDVVNTHSMNDVTTGCWSATKRAGIPLVHTLRNYDLLCSNGALWHDGKPCPARCHVISAAKKRQHLFINGVASNSLETLRIHTDAGLFRHISPDLRRVIWSISAQPHAVIKRAEKHGPITFGYFGRIKEEKGVGTLLEAAKRLGPRSNYRILVGGNLTPDTERFQYMASGLPVGFLGFVTAASFFAQVDVLVVPSIWAEPLPRTALEAYAAGVPVLSSRAGGTPDLVGHNNEDWLFPPADVDALANRLQSIIARGRDQLPPEIDFAHVLNETTESIVVERYISLYRDVLAASAGMKAA